MSETPIDPQEDPPIKPGQPSEPPQESPPGSPRPEVPPPIRDPGEPPRPDELPGNRPDELPMRGPQRPPAPSPTDSGIADLPGPEPDLNPGTPDKPRGQCEVRLKRSSECAMNEDALRLSVVEIKTSPPFKAATIRPNLIR